MATNSPSTPLLALDAVALDTETTGLDARTARLVQVGAIRLRADGAASGGRYESLVDPGLPIPLRTVAVHGITDAAVAGAPRFAEIEPALNAFLGQSILVGHTIAFDLAILRREHNLAGRPWTPRRALDVRWLARIAAPGLGHDDLDELCAWAEIDIVGRHTAIGDAVATAKLFAALVPRLRERGIRTLAEAEAASRQLAERDARNAGGSMAAEPPAADAAPTLARVDSYPYRHRVRDVMSAPPLTADGANTVADALRLLDGRGVSSAFVRTADGAWGIVTERDLLRAVARRGAAAFADRLEDILTPSLHTVRDDDFVYRAIGRMNRLGFRHLGVRDAAGALVGAVTPRNLLRQRAMTAIVLGDAIDGAATAADLARAWAELVPMARALLDEAVEPRAIAQIVSAEICALTRKAALMAEACLASEGHGAPPVPYCVLVLGSAGRGESLLAADQDNAIVFEKGEPGGPEDAWFEKLGTQMTAILDEVGVPLCKGGVMARNAAWRRSVAGWRTLIEGWVRRHNPDDLLNVDIFFDGVPVHGDSDLGELVWSEAYRLGHGAPDFVKMLSVHAPESGAAFTLLGGIRTDESGRIDLKKNGLLPVFTAARILSIRHDIRQRGTPERLRGVAARGIGSADDAEALLAAHQTILGAMFRQQIADAERGVPLSPKVRPAALSKSDLRDLRQALRQVPLASNLVKEGRL